MFYINKPLLPLVAAVAAAISSPVFAQESSSSPVEEIIVTGQKIERSLQDTVDSVAVITSTQIEQRDVSEFAEFVLQTANTHSSESGNLSIRGIQANGVSQGGDGGLASVYIDGATIPDDLFEDGFSTWDASQVEVLRGPQSTLQGRNSLAGAVVITTTAPTHEWEGKYRAQFGENGEQEFAFAGGGSLIEDELAFRFSAEVEEFDGFNRNIETNELSGFEDSEAYRLKFLYTPSWNDKFSALLSLNYLDSESNSGATNVPESGDPFSFSQRIRTTNDSTAELVESDLASLKLDYDINDTWSLTSVSTYSKVERSRDNFDIDGGSLASLNNQLDNVATTFTQELRLAFETERFSGVVGAYLLDLNTDNENAGNTFVNLANAGLTAEFIRAIPDIPPLSDAAINLVISQFDPVDPAILLTDVKLDTDVTSLALFGDVRYEFSDKLDIFAGIRVDYEERDTSSSTLVEFVNESELPDPSNLAALGLDGLVQGLSDGFLAQIASASTNPPDGDSSFTEVLPKLGVSYHWTDDLTTSFSVQRGFRSGGVGSNTVTRNVFEFDPEFTTNYEFSLRSSWLDGALTANANLFYIDWKDQQVGVQLSENNLDRETVNAGAAEVKGFEIELNYVATDNLTIYGSIGQADTEFTDFEIPVLVGDTIVTFDLSGRSFQGSPETTINIGTTYTAGEGFFMNVNANYASGSNSDINPFIGGLNEGDEGFDLQNDSRLLVNAQVGYEWGSVGIYLKATNLFDEEFIDSVNGFADNGVFTATQTLGDPRQLSVSLRGSF